MAQLALLANGWTVHEARTAEAYDILATDPISGDYTKIQVKTIRQRNDRGGDLVVYATKGNGTVYGRSEADMLIGVWAEDNEVPRVFLLENRLLTEYWCSEAKASERWVELNIGLNRQLHVLNAVMGEAVS